MIDTMSNTTYPSDVLKARAMARLADPSGHALANPTQVAGIGKVLAAAEAEYSQEVKDNALLVATLEHEAAVARLAEPVKKATDKDADGNLLYPQVDELDAAGKVIGKLPNPAIIADQAERKAAQATVKAVTAPAKALVAKRAKAVAAKAVA